MGMPLAAWEEAAEHNPAQQHHSSPDPASCGRSGFQKAAPLQARLTFTGPWTSWHTTGPSEQAFLDSVLLLTFSASQAESGYL